MPTLFPMAMSQPLPPPPNHMKGAAVLVILRSVTTDN